MISNSIEFSATLEYAVKLADTLEGLRQYAQETGETALLPLSSAGPLAHLRENLADLCAYAERVGASEAVTFASTASVFGVSAAVTEAQSPLESAPR